MSRRRFVIALSQKKLADSYRIKPELPWRCLHKTNAGLILDHPLTGLRKRPHRSLSAAPL